MQTTKVQKANSLDSHKSIVKMLISEFRRNGQIKKCPVPQCGTHISEKGIKGWDNLKFLFGKLVDEAGIDDRSSMAYARSRSNVIFEREAFDSMKRDEALSYLEWYMTEHGYNENEFAQDDIEE